MSDKRKRRWLELVVQDIRDADSFRRYEFGEGKAEPSYDFVKGKRLYHIMVDRIAHISFIITERRIDLKKGLSESRPLEVLSGEGIVCKPKERVTDQSEFIRLYRELLSSLRERFPQDEEVLTKPVDVHIDPRVLALLFGGIVVVALVVGYVIYLVVSSVINNS
jgi:hypothetical protein